jgi:hypothetical protein
VDAVLLRCFRAVDAVAGFFAVVPVVEEPALAEPTQAQAITAQNAGNAALRILVQALNPKPSLQQKLEKPQTTLAL